MPISPTQRTLKYLRDLGWLSHVVEKWVPQAGRRIDMFGMIDLVAISPDTTLGVQATSGANVAARVSKLRDHENLAAWLACPSRDLWVIGWRKLLQTNADGRRGKRAAWEPRIVRMREVVADG